MDDHYLILGISRDASSDAVTEAYRTMVAKYHPDRHAQNDLIDLAEEKLKSINEAYDVLSDPQRRAAYDQQLGGGTVIRMAGSKDPKPAWPIRLLLGMLAGALVVFFFRLLQHPRALLFFLFTFGLVWFYNRRRRR